MLLVQAVRGSERRRAWVRIALRNGMQWSGPVEHGAAETVDAICDARTEEGGDGPMTSKRPGPTFRRAFSASAG